MGSDTFCALQYISDALEDEMLLVNAHASTDSAPKYRNTDH